MVVVGVTDPPASDVDDRDDDVNAVVFGSTAAGLSRVPLPQMPRLPAKLKASLTAGEYPTVKRRRLLPTDS